MKLDDGRVELFQGKLIQNSLTNALKNGKNLFAGALGRVLIWTLRQEQELVQGFFQMLLRVSEN